MQNRERDELLLARYGQVNPQRRLPNISQETLAEMIGGREKGIYMPNQYIPPQPDRQQAEGVREKAEDSRQDAEQDRGFTEGHRTSEESGRAEAERRGPPARRHEPLLE